jgi:hypothetical protein
MKPKYRLILLPIVCLLMISCKKHGVNPSGADIYNAGYIVAANTHSIAVYWKNGTLVQLGDGTVSTVANAIAVDGNDIYVAGNVIVNEQITTAVIWKNGVATKLTDGSSNADARAITISGGNVYVGGYTNNFQAVYWKNGIVTPLANSAVANSIAVEGGNIYAAGFLFDTQISSNQAVYWTNGVPKECLGPNGDSFDYIGYLPGSASGIAVKDNNVYITGYAGGGKYWKNGAEVDLNNGYFSYPFAIAVNGNDVYLAGETDSPAPGAISSATFWKNGVASLLTQGSSLSRAYAIALDRSDVYIAGQADGKAVYWKNGAEVELAAKGAVYGLTIVSRKW